jgi:mono/diheme cytochrome c family protein
MKYLGGFFAGLIVVALAGAVFIYGGWYNVAAIEPHSGLMHWALTTAMQNSVRGQAKSVTPPPVPPSQKIGEAFRSYDEMCRQCHGAPGKEPAVIGKGLQPPPPVLSDAVRRWDRAELFWIVKNGIRMTGMPAFGPTHSDEDLWLLVAFLQRLPNLTAEQYAEMEQRFRSAEDRQSGGAGKDHRH